MADLLMPVDLKPVHVSRIDKGFSRSGVYFLFLGDEVVYVGQSNSILRRIGEHMSDCSKRFDAVASIPCQALNRVWMEAQYIERFKPRYNRPEPDQRKRSSNRRKALGRQRRKLLAQQSLAYQA